MVLGRALIVMLSISGWLLCLSPVRALGATIAAAIETNYFIFPGGSGSDTANDFHLNIAGTFVGKPKSDKMPNVTLPNVGEARFSGGSVAKGEKLKVSFDSTAVTNRPRGFFTLDGSRVSEDIRSLGLDGQNVVYVPHENGFLATVTLINPFETSVTGSLIASVSTAILADQFSVDLFDTPETIRPYFSTDFSLTSAQELFLPTVALVSDEFILITGSLSVGGDASSPFSLAFSPVPEPSTLLLIALGAAMLAAWKNGREQKRRN